VAFGAYSGAALLGTASTGTAIVTLSGAAAHSATLAFLGGGALSIGGAGMAGGVMLLGGLVAGPALAIMGIVAGANAGANLDNARSNRAEARKIAEELKIKEVVCDGIKDRSNMFETLLDNLDTLFKPMVWYLGEVVIKIGVDWNTFSADDKKNIAATASLAKAIKTVLDTPILTKEGALTDESAQVAGEVQTAFLPQSG
jgi:hypothetical protein